jgi:acetyl esterase/lipase
MSSSPQGTRRGCVGAPRRWAAGAALVAAPLLIGTVRNVLDLWKAKSERPTPLVVFIHGGAFRVGDKSDVSAALVRLCLEAGISVASINYRLSHQAPFPAPMLDGARAIQFLRWKAADWNLDPQRFAASGGSAGAGISLWVGFHNDLADPRSADPVARQSKRLTCLGVSAAQTSYDLRFIQRVIGGRAYRHPALLSLYGLTVREANTPRAHKLYEAASPINYVTRDDPPVFMFYSESKALVPPDAPPNQGIHHPKFGVALKQEMNPLGIQCVLKHRDDYTGKGNVQLLWHRDMVALFRRHLIAE